VILDRLALADLELIAAGATPFAGFHGEADYRRILADGRLADGTRWPVPFVLAVGDRERAAIADAGVAELHDSAGTLRGTVRVTEIFRRDPVAEVRALFGTDDAHHPGVAHVLSRPRWLIAGPVEIAPVAPTFAAHRLSPAALRAEIAARGWTRVAAVDLRGPVLRAHEHLVRLALEQVDGVVLHPLVGESRGDELPADVRFAAFEALAAHLPADRVILAAFPAAPRFGGPREAALHALLRASYGITETVPTEGAFYCRVCEGTATARTCGHGADDRVELSPSRIRAIVRSGDPLPRELIRPEIAEIVRAHYLAGIQAAVPASGPAVTPLRSGFILWFTGMSGAGKSTLAGALAQRLGRERPLEVLAGDEVRTHLSRGLGFSKEDRDVNVHRIAFVARGLARHGVGVITAAISTFADTRHEVRAHAEQQGIAFIEVFARADLASLVERDPKGLYRKALAGELAHFTGVSDPYEPPERPDITVRTDVETIEESVATILAALAARGLVAPTDVRRVGVA
jgi:sulfate adenylyltransferase